MIKERMHELHVECSSEELSSAQVEHRKKQLENLILIQEALQLYLNDKDVELSDILNGGNVKGNMSLENAGMDSSAPYHVKFAFPKNVNENNEPAATKRKFNRTQSPSIQEPIAKKQNTAPSLTQTLRATRKTTGSLPNPVRSYALDDEPEIEVIQERRAITIVGNKQVTPPVMNVAGFRNIAPKMNSLPGRNREGPQRLVKRAPLKPNNLLLLNISVRPRNAASVLVNAAKRKDLDAQVKVILMKTPGEFIEFTMKQGLIRSEQSCFAHKTAHRQPNKLKLGKFQDPNVLASSGGYVWLGECCNKKHISVFSGSIFGHTPVDKMQPTALLKLIYHWSCQTSVSNVETWVKVDKLFVSKVYNYFRCICSVMLHDKIYDFGFEGTKVELGIVSLGTTTADGSKKAVKVEILGLFDRKNKSYRLFASTPETATSSKERFLRILKPVKEVVHRNAVIICDQSVDPTCLNAMSFTKVEVSKTSDDEHDLATNSTIMYYLRKHVPKMFQAALSQLTENQVQLTLDELCWREKYASTSALCFTNIMENIAYITFREYENPGLLPILEFVAENPHSNFRYKNQPHSKPVPNVPTTTIISPMSGPLIVSPTQHSESKVANPMTHTNKIMTKNIQYVHDYSNALKAKSFTPVVSNVNYKSPSTTVAQNKTFTKIPMNSPLLNNASSVVTDVGNLKPKIETLTIVGPLEKKEIEPYFYGRIEGNVNWGQDSNTSVFKCHMCSETFEDNVNFYAHVKYHIEGVTADKVKLDYICPYCNKFFDTINGLNKHKIDIHLMSDLTQMWCRICANRFTSEMQFKSHMMQVHVEAELPYRCEICHYATSFYYEIINHFNKNHRATPYVQCHICLTVKTITPNGAMSFSTRLFQHLHRHMQTKLNCTSCRLIFYSKYLLTEHKKEHLSCANVNDVIRYTSPSGHKALYFSPKNETVKTQNPVILPMKGAQIALSVTLDDYSNITSNLEATKYYCIECDAPLHMENHFKKYRKCTRCSYSTCCPNMVMRHSQIFHPIGSSRTLNYFIGAPIPLGSPLFCPCEFSCKSGHQMAKHLILCSGSVRKTAYQNLEDITNFTDTFQFENAGFNLDYDEDDVRSLSAFVEPMDTDIVIPIMPLSVELTEGE